MIQVWRESKFLTAGSPAIVGVCLSAALLLSCSSLPMTRVESSNQNSRIDYLVIHGTSENFGESLRLLTSPTANPVSSHYLVPKINDPSYPDGSLRVYSLVDEPRRAWHAGVSYWAEEENLNDRSIGIEVVNEFKCNGTEMPLEEIDLAAVDCDFPACSDEQISLLIALLKNILARYPGIDPIDVVGHSDIAIMRKSDPGPLFPWQRLYEEGIGAWPDTEAVLAYQEQFLGAFPAVDRLQQGLLKLGYQVEVTGEYDRQTRFAVRAFQLHFRPADHSGSVDLETVALLWALLQKYRAAELAEMESMPLQAAE